MPEAIPLVGLSIALLIEVCELMLILALLFIWRQTFGALFKLAADALTFKINTHTGFSKTFHLGGPFSRADYAITTWLNAEKAGLDIEIGATWHALQAAWTATAESLQWLARETADTLDWFSEVKLPKWAKYILAAGLPAALLTKLIASAVSHLRPEIHKSVKVVERAVPNTVTRIIRYAVPATLPIALGLPKIRTDITNLWKWRLRAEKRIGKVEKFAAAGVFAGLLANAIGVPLRCVRKGNLGRVSRRLCGMDTSYLEGLLAGGLLIVGTLSVVEFTEELRSVEDEAVQIMGRLVREFPA